MKKIPLNQGKVAIIDDEDYSKIISHKYKWRAEKNRNTFYAASITDTGSTIRMHTLIMNPPKGKQVHHINKDGLDNRKINLELVTRIENLRSRVPSWQEDIRRWTILVSALALGKNSKNHQ